VSAACPRCNRAELRREHEGHEAGERVWTVWHCSTCSFTWRDTEPAETLDPDQRGRWFAVDPEALDRYRHNIPPAKS